MNKLLILMIIAQWCGPKEHLGNEHVRKLCRAEAIGCMEKKKWDEDALPACLLATEK